MKDPITRAQVEQMLTERKPRTRRKPVNMERLMAGARNDAPLASAIRRCECGGVLAVTNGGRTCVRCGKAG